MATTSPPLAPLKILNNVKNSQNKKVLLGICVMEKKAHSPPMTEILDRLRAFGEFEVVIFGDRAILQEPVEKWPICDALIAFHSNGFPLEKCKAYAALRKPYLLNELDPQLLLHDRRKVYKRLEESGLPTPEYAVVNRDYPNQEVSNFIEEEDYVEVNGKRINKPFVEKPSDGEDHSIMIYYPSSAGGGSKELFRKVGNRSSEFHPDVRRVRRTGSYLYEGFMPTGGTDVKVYTVGPDYAHAEARKSPVVDGVVMRSADGKEIRYPVLLTPTEKEMARTVCLAFGQAVCGFDLLRSQGKSYVCDVNGWSFVKNSHKYYDDAAVVLRGMLLAACAPHMSSPAPQKLPWLKEESSPGYNRQSSVASSTFGKKEELRCLIAIIRHGDRTPKEKVKLTVTQDRLLALMLKYNGNRPRAEAKLKSAVQLQDLLDALRMLVPRSRPAKDSDSEAEDFENAERLRHVKAVLEEGGHFSGIYRKAQLKPQKWVTVREEGGEGLVERPTEALMVLKYGGVLTHAGRIQAEELGRMFRFNMYPVEAGEGTGLIRLHSTYRHDLKIYSSDEGRVQMSAAAFTKGLLDLEGPLTPILVSLVSKDSPMLDGLDTAYIEMKEAKSRLYELMTSPTPPPPTDTPEDQPWMVDGGGIGPEPLAMMHKLVKLVKSVTAQLKDRCREEEKGIEEEAGEAGVDLKNAEILPYDTARILGKARLDVDRIAAGLPCGSENFLLMFARWKKLERDIYNERKDRFDISKIPDIYDSAKYDLLHNKHLNLQHQDKLFTVAKTLADGVVPNEYGINPGQKLIIGTKIARRLLGKVAIDLQNTIDDSQKALEAFNEGLINPSKRISETYSDDSFSHNPTLTRNNSRSSSEREADGEEALETPYRLDPKYANVRSPQRHVRTRLYFTSESHIHSLLNVLRYCYLDERLNGEQSLICFDALKQLFECKELDYLTHIVIRMYENTEVDFSNPKRFRMELLYSPGAAYNPLEVEPLHRNHVLPVVQPVPIQAPGEVLPFEEMHKMIAPFAMPPEDFPPPIPPQSFAGFFGKSSMFERIVNMWPFNQLPLQSGPSPKVSSSSSSKSVNAKASNTVDSAKPRPSKEDTS